MEVSAINKVRASWKVIKDLCFFQSQRAYLLLVHCVGLMCGVSLVPSVLHKGERPSFLLVGLFAPALRRHRVGSFYDLHVIG